MQQSIQLNRIRIILTVTAVFLLISMLFSCSREVTETPIPAAATAASANSTNAAQTEAVVATLPYDRVFFVPCSNGGEGEDVSFTGDIHFVGTLTGNKNGFIMTSLGNTQKVRAVGLISGEEFVVSAGGQETLKESFDNGQFNGLYQFQLRAMGTQSGFIVNFKFKVTVTPGAEDEEVAVQIIDEDVACR